MTIRVNLIGLFRSGTNYARTILEWNYDVTVSYDAYGWKHAMVPTFSNASRLTYPDGELLVVVKNPYSVLLSWYKYAINNGRNIRGDTGSFSNFIRNKVYFRDDINKSLAPEYYFSDPVQMWNSVVWNHLSVAEQTGGFIVEYEDLLRNPEETSELIAQRLGLTRKSAEFIRPQNIVRNMGDGLNRDNKSRYITKNEFDSSYYLYRQYVREYTADDLIFVTRSLDAEVIKRSGIELANDKSNSGISPVLCTLSGDSRLLPFACFLESNRAIDNLPVHLIPFDEEISLTEELAEIYSVQLVTPNPKWDSLGKAIVGAKETKPGVQCWKYFRKLNAFDGSPRHVMFADSNVVLLNSLRQAFNALETHDLVFGDRSGAGRNFHPWATNLLNVLEPNLQHGFNASFWITRCDLYSDLDIEPLLQRPRFRVMLGKAPEQSFMQLAAVLLRKRIGALGEIVDNIGPMLRGDNAALEEISYVFEHKMTQNGKIPLAIKWSDTAIHKQAIKGVDMYKSLFEPVLDRVKDRPQLIKALNNQYRIVMQRG